VAYLFVDGVAERLHAGLPHEAVLCAWGSLTTGGRSCCTWRRTRRKTRRAAWRSSRTSSVGASPTRCWWSPGLIRAVETCFPGPAPALPGAPPSQSAQQGARQPMAGDCHSGARRLRGGLAGAGRVAARRFRAGLRAGAPRAREVLPRGLRRLHRPPALPAAPTGR
jgi:hypothetical protein